MRPIAFLPVVLAAGVAVGCGGSAEETGDVRVSLTIAHPRDALVLRDDHVRVAGTVTPSGASVAVNGSPAEVTGRRFVANVTLRPGANVIDVTATAPGRRPDADAIRVSRDMRIELPRLTGEAEDDAVAQLRSLGLEVEADGDGGFLDSLLPGGRVVCGTEPPAGTPVEPRSRVTVRVAHSC